MTGEGSIRPKAGGWEVRVSAGVDPAGKRRRISRFVQGARGDAERTLLQLRLEVGDGRAGRGGETTVADLLAAYLSLCDGELSPTTLDRYRDLARLHLIPALGRTPLRKLDPSTLDRLYRDLHRERGLSPATVRQAHAVLRSALREAQRWGWVERNVAQLARPPRMTKHEVDPPSAAVVRQLIEAARVHGDLELADFLVLAAATGARRGELVGLQWGDLDEVKGVLRIRRAVVETQGRLVVKDTKSHQGRRVALDVGTVGVLRARRVRRAAQALAVGAPVGLWLFPADLSGVDPQVPDRLTQRFCSLCRRAGVVGVRLHDLRHYVATAAIEAGVPLPTVSKRLGHRDTSTTANIYAHALEDADQRAADVLGAALHQ